MVKLSLAMGKWIHEVQELPMSELNQYMAMNTIEPIGEDRSDIRTAYAAAVSYNIQRPRRARALKTKDFMVNWYAPRQQSQEHIKHVLTMFANAQNAKVNKNG